MEILDQLKHLSVSHRRSLRDDDFFSDRLHHRYTVAILISFCVVITAQQYAGEPINCWVPAQFTGSFEQYTNRLCWIQNTYYVDPNQDIPDLETDRAKTTLKYYQWIHLILLCQALLFFIPRIVWRSLNDKCGIEIINYVDAAMKYEMVDKFNEREKIMDFLSTHIIRFINAKYSYRTDKNQWRLRFKRAASYICFWTGKNFGNYLLILYSFCKLLYLANVIGQLFLIGILLGIQNYHRFGFDMVEIMKNGTDFNHFFPKVSHCDFKIRELGNDHHYTVQCVLTINIFTEKIYVILWFWLVFLAFYTSYDFLKFSLTNFIPRSRYSYVSKHIRIFNNIKQAALKQKLAEFSSNYLKPDVVFVLHLLSHNVNSIVASEISSKLWLKYCDDKHIEPSDGKINNSTNNNNNEVIYFDSNEIENYSAFPYEKSQKTLQRKNGDENLSLINENDTTPNTLISRANGEKEATYSTPNKS